MEQYLINSIEYCKKRYGWMVTIKDFYNLMLKTPGTSDMMRWFINHENGYCQLIKSNPVAFSHCVDIGNRGLCAKLLSMKDTHAGFVGTCYGGVQEYVTPIYCGNILLGAVIIGACKCDKARQESTFRRLEEEFGFSKEVLQAKYQANLNDSLNDVELIEHEAKLWSAYIQLLCEKNLDKKALAEAVRKVNTGRDVRSDKLNQAILFIKENLTSHISVSQVAKNCYCSESTIAHLFQEELGTGINAFVIGERIRLAQHLLRSSNISISEVATRCGFVSNKYLSGMFKKHTGMTPTEYRASQNTNEERKTK